MPTPSNSLKFNRLKELETPYLIQQVDTHLVFGPCVRYLPFGYVVLVGGIIGVVASFFASGVGSGEYFGNIIGKLIYLIIPFGLLKMSKRQQAIIGWLAVKFALGFGAFLIATVGSAESFTKGRSDVWANLFLTLPCVYFGIHSGNWHWN
jgi:hypothetical protein